MININYSAVLIFDVAKGDMGFGVRLASGESQGDVTDELYSSD